MRPHHKLTKLITNGNIKETILQYNSTLTPPTLYTYPCLLKACTNITSSPYYGQMVHTHVIKSGYVSETYASTSLVSMYMRFGLIGSAVQVFDEMPHPNEASVNAVISGFLRNGRFGEGFLVFKEVGVRRFRVGSNMIANVAAGCRGGGGGSDHGVQVHCWAVKIGVESDVYVGTAVLSMYMGCGDPVSAVKVFEMMEVRNVVSYNALLSGLVQNGVFRTVCRVFKEMLGCLNELPNAVTLVSVLGACSNALNLQYGSQVHGVSVKVGLSFDTKVGTALVDMYAKCGCCDIAYGVFVKLKGSRNLITWNSMISGMLLNGEFDSALGLFSDLKSEGLVPDSATWNTMISGLSRLGEYIQAFGIFRKMISEGIAPTLKSLTSVLSACSSASSLQPGNTIHSYAIRACMNDDEFFATALIDMYMKCGKPGLARTVFDQFKVKPLDTAFWNAIISGYVNNGLEESAFEIFNLMQRDNVQPNCATFVSMLSVCSHSGKLEKGLKLFEMMSRDYGLTPSPKHIDCILDLLGRSGHLGIAQELSHDNREELASLLSSFLGAAGHYIDSNVVEDMAEKLSRFEPNNSVADVG